MATKDETLQYISDNYPIESLSEDALKIVFELEGGRTQVVYAIVLESLLLVDSPFAALDDINANIAFKLAEESFFGIRRSEDFYFVRHVIPLADVDASEIDLGLGLVAQTADTLESVVGGDNL
jgi:ABC-type taurine transport system ATPase subunit